MRRFQLRFLAILFFLAPVAAMAQVVDPCIDPLDPEALCICDPTNPVCPIDGGLSFLIAAGIGLGAKKAYQHHKKGLENN